MNLANTASILFPLALIAAGCGGDASLSADAGDDVTISVGEAPTFDGCDSDGDIANYRWTIVETPPARSADVGKVLRETEANCSFTLENAMLSEEVGTWVVELLVTDADQGSLDTVTVVVE